MLFIPFFNFKRVPSPLSVVIHSRACCSCSISVLRQSEKPARCHPTTHRLATLKNMGCSLGVWIFGSPPPAALSFLTITTYYRVPKSSALVNSSQQSRDFLNSQSLLCTTIYTVIAKSTPAWNSILTVTLLD